MMLDEYIDGDKLNVFVALTGTVATASAPFVGLALAHSNQTTEPISSHQEHEIRLGPSTATVLTKWSAISDFGFLV